MIILGAGSQAKVVIALVRAVGKYHPRGCIEIGRDPSRIGSSILDVPVLGDLAHLAQVEDQLHDRVAALAIGDNRIRGQLLAEADQHKLGLPVLLHPSAVVCPTAQLDDGTVIAAQAFVGTEAKLGRGCIVNTAASVDHDCQLGECVHVAVGARLAGNVKVGAYTTIGAGAVVIPGIKIGADVTVGAGAVVIRDLPDGCTAVGNPARIVEAK